MKKIFIALLSTVFLFAACNSSDNDGPNAADDAVTIEEGEIVAMDEAEFKSIIDGDAEKIWAASAFTLAGLTTFTDCRLDDSMLFRSDGTYEYNGGQDLCGAEDDAFIKTGTWEVNFDDATIIFDKGTSNEEVGEVIGMTETEIKLKGAYMMMEVRGVYTSD